IYFLLVIGLFLALTIMKLSGGRQTRSAAVRAARYSLLIALVIMAGYISSLPALTTYYDTTRFKDRTLTKNSQEIVKQLSKPVKITTYINAVDYKAPYGAPKYRIKDLKQFEQYQRFLPDLKIEYVTYYDTVFYNPNQTKTIEEQARRAATAHGFDFDKFLKPEEIRQRINLIPEENLFTRVVEHDGKTTFLRMFNDMFVYPHEPEISAALKRLLVKAPVVGVLQENDERSIDKTGDKAYKMILKELTNRSALVNQGFDVINVSLNEGEIPRDISVLLIADPKMDYSAEQLAKISSYIEAGGNLIVAGEPGRQTALNSILSQVGVKLNSGLLLQQSEDFEADLIQARFTENARAFGFTFNDRSIVTFPGANGISLVEDKGFKVTPLLMTDKTSTWNREEQVDLSKDKIVFDSLRETKIQVPVAVALTRNIGDKEQKIIVTGDADFMTNAELNRYNIRTINPNFITKMFKWFSNGEFPIDTSRKESIDKKVLVTRSGITWMKVFILGVIPFLIGAMGGITLIRRKRQ
ncbi:MAG TPA: DUF4350 domain-containing protein, partial [Parasegetibacter sp.]